MPKEVGATFCSKTGPFFSCACSKSSWVHVCPLRSRPHSAAKQGRFVRLAALNFALPSGNLEFKLCPSQPGSKNGPSSARVRPKGSGPHSAAKQGRSFRVPALNHPVSMCAHCGQGQFCSKTGPFFSCGCSKPLSQALNSAPRSPDQKMDPRVLVCVGATFCSKTGMFFSCACSKPSGVHVCPRQSRPHSAAKQSRFFRLAALNFALHREICKTVADFGLPNSVHETCILIKARCQAFLFLFVWLPSSFFSCGCS